MTSRDTVARAFELARGGRCRTLEDIRRKLTTEGFESVQTHLSGSTIKRQLIAALAPLR